MKVPAKKFRIEKGRTFQAKRTAKTLSRECVGGVKDGQPELERREQTQDDTGEAGRGQIM